jgi:hypothetical protein
VQVYRQITLRTFRRVIFSSRTSTVPHKWGLGEKGSFPLNNILNSHGKVKSENR